MSNNFKDVVQHIVLSKGGYHVANALVRPDTTCFVMPTLTVNVQINISKLLFILFITKL